ncbi:MAG: hypothetical protein KY464_16955, partial [Gemmatimonadetes bacterium]|nr:hypothetical protein [Gemmatimonadota bacterium]
MKKIALLSLSAALLLAGCDVDGALGPRSGNQRWNLDASYRWVLEGWDTNAARPIGHPSVLVTWDLPTGWSGEPFRIYARRSNDSRYGLVATVTSCSARSCGYADRNVVAGRSYDYYITTYDDRNNREDDASDAVRIDVPAVTAPQIPGGLVTRGLD